jgi:hypothetical protein
LFLADEKVPTSSFRADSRMKKETNPTDSIRSGTQMKYIFNKYPKDDQSYLLGPIRQRLIEHERLQIFPSGYCRLKDMNQEKEIEQKLKALLPAGLRTNLVQLNNDDLAIFLSSSAAERILEQSKNIFTLTEY